MVLTLESGGLIRRQRGIARRAIIYLTDGALMSQGRIRQAGEGIELTAEMVDAGVEALRQNVPLDLCRPILSEEDIVIRIFERVLAARRR